MQHRVDFPHELHTTDGLCTHLHVFNWHNADRRSSETPQVCIFGQSNELCKIFFGDFVVFSCRHARIVYGEAGVFVLLLMIP